MIVSLQLSSSLELLVWTVGRFDCPFKCRLKAPQASHLLASSTKAPHAIRIIFFGVCIDCSKRELGIHKILFAFNDCKELLKWSRIPADKNILMVGKLSILQLFILNLPRGLKNSDGISRWYYSPIPPVQTSPISTSSTLDGDSMWLVSLQLYNKDPPICLAISNSSQLQY